MDSSVASSVEGSASLLSSEDETGRPSGNVDKVDKEVTLKRRRSSTRKPRTKGVTKKLQDQVKICCCLLLFSMRMYAW
jgi:hypothetical protein